MLNLNASNNQKKNQGYYRTHFTQNNVLKFQLLILIEIQTQMASTQQRLCQTLVKLSQKVLKTDCTSKLSLVKNLLIRISHDCFLQLFQMPHSTFAEVMANLIRFYKQQKHEIITISYIENKEEENEFIHLYRLVIDLFLTYQRQQFVQQMINLQQQDKETLMPFVEDINNRKFIGQRISIAEQLDELENLQFIHMKQTYTKLVQKYEKLKQNHDYLQAENASLKLQIKAYQSEKYMLLEKMQLGQDATFQEIADKYMEDIKQYNMLVDKLTSEIKEQRDSLEASQVEIHHLASTIQNDQKYQNKYKQMKYTIQQNQLLQTQVKNLSRLNMSLKTQLQFLKNKASKLQEELIQKSNKLEMNEIQLNKYQKLKKANILFRKTMMKQFNGF